MNAMTKAPKILLTAALLATMLGACKKNDTADTTGAGDTSATSPSSTSGTSGTTGTTGDTGTGATGTGTTGDTTGTGATGTGATGREVTLRLAGNLVPTLRPVLEALEPVVTARSELLPEGRRLYDELLVEAP